MWSKATIRHFMKAFPYIEKLYVRGYNWDFETILFETHEPTQLKVIDSSYGFYDHFVDPVQWDDVWRTLPYLVPSLEILKIKLHPQHFHNIDVGSISKLDRCFLALQDLPLLREIN